MEIKVNPNKVSKYFTLPTMKFNEQCKVFSKQDALFTPTIPMHSKHFIFGIEVEVENVRNPNINYDYNSYWTVVADNSLRNHGIEFVSKPLRTTQIEGALTQLAKSLPKEHEFSPRTSVHVHMNVRDLTLTQITSLVVLYTAMENVLFKWVGHNRENNVFCTKLIDTDYVQSYINLNNNPTAVAHHWNKYTALNLEPMTTKGTVEFRHMHGTIDIPRLCKWINILSCMKTYALNTPLTHVFAQIEELNSSSSYEAFVYSVFDQYGRELITSETAKLMESAITYIKLATIFHEPNVPTVAEDPLPIADRTFTEQYITQMLEPHPARRVVLNPYLAVIPPPPLDTVGEYHTTVNVRDIRATDTALRQIAEDEATDIDTAWRMTVGAHLTGRTAQQPQVVHDEVDF